MKPSFNSPPTRRRAVGFTLVEVMVAITIFAMVMAAIYSSWSAILRASRAGLKAAAEAQRTRVTLRALGEAIGGTMLFTENIHLYAFNVDTSGSFAALSFVSHLPPSFPGSGLFGDQVVRRVTFSVEPDRAGLNQLLLRQSSLLEPIDQAAEPYTIVLAPHVNEFSMVFWDTNVMDWVEEWLWTNRLPKIVRFHLSIGEIPQGRLQADDIAVKTVYLSSMAIPREAQLPARAGGARPPGSGAGNPGGIRPGPRTPTGGAR